MALLYRIGARLIFITLALLLGRAAATAFVVQVGFRHPAPDTTLASQSGAGAPFTVVLAAGPPPTGNGAGAPKEPAA